MKLGIFSGDFRIKRDPGIFQHFIVSIRDPPYFYEFQIIVADVDPNGDIFLE
jgi:hypothetical protein